MSWQPIKTAPKDGTRVLFGGRWKTGKHRGEWSVRIFGFGIGLHPRGWATPEWHGKRHWNIEWTHWHPLPPEPDEDDTTRHES